MDKDDFESLKRGLAQVDDLPDQLDYLSSPYAERMEDGERLTAFCRAGWEAATPALALCAAALRAKENEHE